MTILRILRFVKVFILTFLKQECSCAPLRDLLSWDQYAFIMCALKLMNHASLHFFRVSLLAAASRICLWFRHPSAFLSFIIAKSSFFNTENRHVPLLLLDDDVNVAIGRPLLTRVDDLKMKHALCFTYIWSVSIKINCSILDLTIVCKKVLKNGIHLAQQPIWLIPTERISTRSNSTWMKCSTIILIKVYVTNLE